MSGAQDKLRDFFDSHTLCVRIFNLAEICRRNVLNPDFRRCLWTGFYDQRRKKSTGVLCNLYLLYTFKSFYTRAIML